MENKTINIDDVKDFAIEEKIDENSFGDLTVTTIDEITKFDFKSDKEFNIEEAYEYVKHTEKPKETKELIQQREADVVIKENSEKYLSKDYVNMLKNGYDNLIAMLKRYDVNSDTVKSMTEKEKDKIYGIAEFLFNEFQKNLNKMDFSFNLSRDEWKFLLDVLNNKLEYDQNEVFQMKELRDKYLKEAVESSKSVPRESGIIPTTINVNNLIVLYHLISKYKVKGINRQHYAFLDIMTKIGERMKLFNAYNVWIQRLSNDFQTWGGSLSFEEDMVDQKNNNDNNENGNNEKKEEGQS